MKAERRRAQNNVSLVGEKKGLFICNEVMVFHCAAEGSFGLLMTSDVECCKLERGWGRLKLQSFINSEVRKNMSVHLSPVICPRPHGGGNFLYHYVSV